MHIDPRPTPAHGVSLPSPAGLGQEDGAGSVLLPAPVVAPEKVEDAVPTVPPSPKSLAWRRAVRNMRREILVQDLVRVLAELEELAAEEDAE